jgi:hypothetical protein
MIRNSLPEPTLLPIGIRDSAGNGKKSYRLRSLPQASRNQRPFETKKQMGQEVRLATDRAYVLRVLKLLPQLFEAMPLQARPL